MTDGNQGTYTLLGDQPILEGEDSLGFERIAEDLARLIVSSAGSSPFTLGIEGGWGQGKSSLMGRLEAKLQEASTKQLRVSTARFNAWTAGEGDVLEGLVKSVLDQLDERILRRLARKRHLISWLRAVAVFVAHVFRLGSVVDRLWTELNVDPKARNEMRDLMVDAMERWRDQETRLGRNRLLVVFVDDLDRCSPENVFQVFEAMKLYLEAPGLVFVIGFDAGIVSDAVLHEKHFSKELTGDRYLEKMIQIRYRIPPTSDEHASKLILGYMRDSGTQELFDATAQALVVERNTRNPRRIKRFINSFILEYRIDEEWSQLGAETLIRVLILDFYFRDFAQLLYSPSEREPIGEFLNYVEAREFLRRPPPSGEEGARMGLEVDLIFESYGLSPPSDGVGHESAKDSLQRLEEELPEPMLALAGDREFTTLVEGFGDRAARQRLEAKLHRRSAAAVPAPAEEDSRPDTRTVTTSGAQRKPLIDIVGLRVLWIDDDHKSQAAEVAHLASRFPNIALRTASGYDEARPTVIADWPQAIISDIRRHDNDRAGLDDLARFRREDGYDGPAIFYTSRVTRSRRAEAAELGAGITSSMAELVEFIAATADRVDWPAAQS